MENGEIIGNLTERTKNITATASENLEGSFIADTTTGRLLDLISLSIDMLVNAGRDNSWWIFWIMIFAIIGFFAVIAGIGTKAFMATSILFKVFFITPLIIVMGFVNKNKRKQRLEEWHELEKGIKEESKKIPRWAWLLWVLRIAIPILVIALIVIWL